MSSRISYFQDGPVQVDVNELKKCDGEATANNRKAKLIFLYEWEIKLGFIGEFFSVCLKFISFILFSAHVSGSDVEYKGTIEIPNLSDENDASEVDVSFLLAHFVFPKLFHTKMFCFRSTCPWT